MTKRKREKVYFRHAPSMHQSILDAPSPTHLPDTSTTMHRPKHPRLYLWYTQTTCSPVALSLTATHPRQPTQVTPAPPIAPPGKGRWPTSKTPSLLLHPRLPRITPPRHTHYLTFNNPSDLLRPILTNNLIIFSPTDERYLSTHDGLTTPRPFICHSLDHIVAVP